MLDAITEWFTNLLMGPNYEIGNEIWNLVMALVGNLITTTPQGFSSEAWDYVSNTLYSWALGIGIALLNIFFLVGFFREASNLKENVTWETLIMYGFKLVLANGLMHSGLKIMREFFVMASKLTGQVYFDAVPPFSTSDIDVGTVLFFQLFGLVYVLIVLICGGIILFTVYGRYLKLYLITAVEPIALSTLAGGRGMEQSAYAWIKSFLVAVFEIVIIGMTMTIAGMMISHLDFGAAGSGLLSYADGFLQVLQNMLTMVIMTGAVKGADHMLRRTFAL